MKFSFVIPIFNGYSLLHQLLWDIFKNCTRPDEIILVDDCSDEMELQRGIEWWIRTDMLPIEYIKRPKNQGFLLTSNFGLKQAKGDVIALVSTDVRIHNDVVRYSKEINSNEMLGGRYLDFDTGWNTFNEITYPYLEGWFLCMSDDLWKKCGYFDEKFAPHDMEDVDISTRVRSVDGVLRVYPEGYVSHIGAASIGYTSERELITQRNKKIFQDKWVA